MFNVLYHHSRGSGGIRSESSTVVITIRTSYVHL